MSTTTAIALITANFIPGMFMYFHLSKRADDVGAMVTTGVVDGTPVPLKYRWVILNQSYSGYVFGAVACAIFLVLTNLRIAAEVSNADTARLAYVAAVVGGTGAVAWLAYFFTEYTLYRSFLRDAEATAESAHKRSTKR